MRMFSNGRFVFLDWHIVEAFATPLQQRGDLYVNCSVWWRPFECFWLLFLESPLIFAYCSSVILDDKVVTSSLWHLATTQYFILAAMSFLVLAGDGASGYQCADSCLHLSCLGVLFLLPTRLRTPIQHYWFRHLKYGTAFDHASAYVAIQLLAMVDWMPCGTDERSPYYTFCSTVDTIFIITSTFGALNDKESSRESGDYREVKGYVAGREAWKYHSWRVPLPLMLGSLLCW